MNPDDFEALAGADNAWKEYIDSIGEVDWNWREFVYEPPATPLANPNEAD